MSSKIKEKKTTAKGTNTPLEESASRRMTGQKKLYSSMFEVFGRVQGESGNKKKNKYIYNIQIGYSFSLAGVYFRKVGLALFLRYFRGFSAYFCHLAHSTQGQAAGHKRLVHEHAGWHCQGHHRGPTGYTLRNVSTPLGSLAVSLLNFHSQATLAAAQGKSSQPHR